MLDNINADNSISNVNVRGEPLPKIVAYADDIACLIKPDTNTLQKIFEHYDNLTSVSGLKLNADKTEIISMGGNASHEVSYNNLRVKIDILEQIKVNGLLLSYNNELARKENIRKMLEAVRVQLANWTKMNLSIIGKIQIYKTFGLSQILYTLATVQITPPEEKSLTNLIYKFIWNKDMSTNKAPDRIKRNILLGKIKSLGFGMIDYKEVVKSIRIRNVIRLLNLKNTPLAKIIRANINTSLINVQNLHPIREPIDSAIKIIRLTWMNCLGSEDYRNNHELYDIVKREYVGNLTLNKFKKQKIMRKFRNDTVIDIIAEDRSPQILNKLDPKITNYISTYSGSLNQGATEITWDSHPYKGKIIKWPKITSKMIRGSLNVDKQITPKLIPGSNPKELTRLGNTIHSLNNTRLKTILLRCLHGDVYSKERMLNFGMVDDNRCVRCNQVESTSHLLYECTYVKQLWLEVSKLTGIYPTSISKVLGVDPTHDKVTLTIHAETIRRLLSIERPIIDPKKLLKSIISNLYILERGITKYQINKYLETIKLT